MAGRRVKETGPDLFGELPEPPRKKAGKKPAKAPAAKSEQSEPAPDLTGVRRYARVALNRPISCEYTYGIPPEFEELARPGARVAVPFGPRREVGVVVGVEDDAGEAAGRVKLLARVLDEDGPIVGEELLELTRWMAEEYACAWGEALAAVLPAGLKREHRRRTVNMAGAVEGVGEVELASLEEKFPKQHRLLRTLLDTGGDVELRDILRRLNLSDSAARTLERKGWIRIEKVVVESDALLTGSDDRPRHARLSEHQDAAVKRIRELLDGGGGTVLLRGVTGSGKTEVYLRAIEAAREQDRGAIVLVPEIALTPQTVGWFRSRFGNVAVLHSKLTDAQRLDMWLRVRRGEARVVVGARSALFAPVRDLGVIVVDEEHEPSFKQGTVPRYHARDVAVRRAAMAGAVCILGSATPALESALRVERGEYELLELPERVSGGSLPPVDIVDLRTEPGGGVFSKRLVDLLRETLERGEQAILFQNRRGFAPVLWCPGCKETVRCGQCDVALTFHRGIGRLVCHACCEERKPPRECPTCTFPGLRAVGAGSEQVAAAIAERFPEARIARMDSDTMVRREDYETTLGAFGRGELDVLVGTQMIAKGLDFPRVTLVGIVSADSALHLPDFRASERTFQLIAQVAGRAGRGELPGRIVVQTHAPEHPSIRAAANHDYNAFRESEDELRRELGYPPHGRLLRVLFEDEEEPRAASTCEAFATELRAVLEPGDGFVLGPAPAPMSLLRGRFRYHLLFKAPLEGQGFARARHWLLERARATPRPRVTVDVDPVSML